MSDETVSHRELRLAESVCHQLSEAFVRRKLQPAFSNFLISHLAGMTPLIAVLDTSKLGDHAPYVRPELLHQLKTDLGGLPVYLSNTSGIRYVILLSPLPKLPHKVDLPGELASGKLALGIRYSGQAVQLDWEDLTHMAVLGKSGSGKSVFLQSIAYQAIRNDVKLLLSDTDQTTFGMLEEHPALLAPIAASPKDALGLVEKAVMECNHRAGLFNALPEKPQKLSEYNGYAVKHSLEPLSRILVVLDEASSVLMALGGAKGEMGQALATLGWHGRKFGVHFVFAAQEFTKDILGPVREQVGLSLCFRVRSPQMAEKMGCVGADRLPEGRPGLAISDRFGVIQTYFIDKALLNHRHNLLPVLSDLETSLFQRAITEDNKLPTAKVQEWGRVSEWQARRMIGTWTLRGWIAKDPKKANAFCLTPKARDLLSNHQTPQTASNHSQTGVELLKPSQTGLGSSQTGE